MYTTQFIESLSKDEVFVFGSNLNGFHGAGSAGYAMRGTTKNTWRNDAKFCDIVKGRSSDKRGLWAVFGVGEGIQHGHDGSSYAIPTVERPGFQGKVDVRAITTSLVKFNNFALAHPHLKFMVVQLGATRSEGGYSWLGKNMVRGIWLGIQKHVGIAPNIVLPESQEVRIQ